MPEAWARLYVKISVQLVFSESTVFPLNRRVASSSTKFYAGRDAVELIGPRNGWSGSRGQTPHFLVSVSYYVLWLVSADAFSSSLANVTDQTLGLGQASEPRPHRARQSKEGSLSETSQKDFGSMYSAIASMTFARVSDFSDRLCAGR